MLPDKEGNGKHPKVQKRQSLRHLFEFSQLAGRIFSFLNLQDLRRLSCCEEKFLRGVVLETHVLLRSAPPLKNHPTIARHGTFFDAVIFRQTEEIDPHFAVGKLAKDTCMCSIKLAHVEYPHTSAPVLSKWIHRQRNFYVDATSKHPEGDGMLQTDFEHFETCYDKTAFSARWLSRYRTCPLVSALSVAAMGVPTQLNITNQNLSIPLPARWICGGKLSECGGSRRSFDRKDSRYNSTNYSESESDDIFSALKGEPPCMESNSLDLLCTPSSLFLGSEYGFRGFSLCPAGFLWHREFRSREKTTANLIEDYMASNQKGGTAGAASSALEGQLDLVAVELRNIRPVDDEKSTTAKGIEFNEDDFLAEYRLFVEAPVMRMNYNSSPENDMVSGHTARRTGVALSKNLRVITLNVGVIDFKHSPTAKWFSHLGRVAEQSALHVHLERSKYWNFQVEEFGNICLSRAVVEIGKSVMLEMETEAARQKSEQTNESAYNSEHENSLDHFLYIGRVFIGENCPDIPNIGLENANAGVPFIPMIFFPVHSNPKRPVGPAVNDCWYFPNIRVVPSFTLSALSGLIKNCKSLSLENIFPSVPLVKIISQNLTSVSSGGFLGTCFAGAYSTLQLLRITANGAFKESCNTCHSCNSDYEVHCCFSHLSQLFLHPLNEVAAWATFLGADPSISEIFPAMHNLTLSPNWTSSWPYAFSSPYLGSAIIFRRVLQEGNYYDDDLGEALWMQSVSQNSQTNQQLLLLLASLDLPTYTPNLHFLQISLACKKIIQTSDPNCSRLYNGFMPPLPASLRTLRIDQFDDDFMPGFLLNIGTALKSWEAHAKSNTGGSGVHLRTLIVEISIGTLWRYFCGQSILEGDMIFQQHSSSAGESEKSKFVAYTVDWFWHFLSSLPPSIKKVTIFDFWSQGKSNTSLKFYLSARFREEVVRCVQKLLQDSEKSFTATTKVTKGKKPFADKTKRKFMFSFDCPQKGVTYWKTVKPSH